MPEQIRSKDYDVFVSYKREDDAAREVLCDALAARGYEVFWDAKLGIDDWKGQLREEIAQSKLVIVLWSALSAQSENVKAEAYGAFQLKKLMSAPIEDNSVVPRYFKDTNLHPFQSWADASGRKAQLAKILDSVERLTGGPSRKPKPPIKATIPVELGDLPAAPDKLIGREREMELLRNAWESGVNAVVLHALGGAGKSALLRAFVNERLARGGDGAARIYGWSAYSQGSGEQKRADADTFISRALNDSGYDGPPIKDSVQRARKLAELIQRSRVLLLLDGLEPLQDAPGVNKGRFKDKGLAELVKKLGAMNQGLMVLTSRQEVPELEGFGDLVIHHELEKLSDEAGADLLVELGVRGKPRELKAAVQDVEGHALSVTLLGTYLAEVCGGDIHQRDHFNFGEVILSPEEEENADKTIRYAKRAEKVMAGYLEQFDKLAEGSKGLGGPERALLHILGLFDRPADGAAVDMLLAERIPGLTDELFVDRVEKSGFLWFRKKIELRDLTQGERIGRLREAKSRLRKLRLLAKANPKDPHELDAHPVVRAYFAKRLEETAPEAAKTAHEKLYRHYAAAAPDLPDTLEEMQPLFHAVQHGVKAGHVQEAFDEVFRRRIERGNDDYIIRLFGAFGTDLAALAHFFKPPWTTSHPELSLSDQAWVLGSAAFALMALGRLRDSLAPRRAGLTARVAQENWAGAARNGDELCTTLLTLGSVEGAVAAAEQAVEHADRSGQEFHREFCRASLANARAAAGNIERAAALFAEAEMVRAGSRPDSQQLISLSGYRYGDLLLALGHQRMALERGRDQLAIAQKFLGHGLGLDDIGYAWLLLGRSQNALGEPEGEVSLDTAVDSLRKAGVEIFLPEGLLARAAHRRKRVAAGETALLAPLREDLAEVEDIAEPEMRLYLTDLALERARLALDVPSSVRNEKESAAYQTAIAEKLIAATGYHRRDLELAELKARLAALA
jgi:hypothetical protein